MEGVTPETLPDRPIRREVARALDILEAEAVTVVMAALRPIIDRTAQLVVDAGVIPALTAPVTASALDELSYILQAWGVAVDEEVLPYYRSVFQAGGYSALSRITAARSDPNAPELPTNMLAPLPDDYLAEPASRHLAMMRNRFTFIGERAWTHARTVLLDGMDKGKGIDEIAANLREVTDLTARQAAAVARTYVVGSANAGAFEQAVLLGADAPRYKQWLATLDRRTRPSHVEADDDVVELIQTFDVGTARLLYPGDPTGPDAEVVNCRCTVLFTDNPDGEFGDEDRAIRQTGGVTGQVAKPDTGPELLGDVPEDLTEARDALNEFRQMRRPMWEPGAFEPSAELRAYEEARLRVGAAIDDAIRLRLGRPKPIVGPGPYQRFASERNLMSPEEWREIRQSRAFADAARQFQEQLNDEKNWIRQYQHHMRNVLADLGTHFGDGGMLKVISPTAAKGLIYNTSVNVPQRWLRYMNDHPILNVVQLSPGQRAYYEGRLFEVNVPPNDPGAATHEVFHHAEKTVPGLTETQWYFKWVREANKPAPGGVSWDPLEERYPGMAVTEWVRPNGYPNSYMGRTYNTAGGAATYEPAPSPFTHYEVWTTSSEALFLDPDNLRWQTWHTETLDQLGLRRWMMAVLATIG